MKKECISKEEIYSSSDCWLYLDDSDKENPVIYAELMDVEGDFFKVNFNYDGCATIDTENMTYIALTQGNLLHLSEALEEAEEVYKLKFKQ